MSFFANLLGGTLQGVGAGMSAMAADEEKLQAQRALLQDKQQAALELQQQRTADRQWQQEQMLQMRAGSAGGAGGGNGKGFNLMEEAARAQTPEQKQDLVNRVRAVHEDAGLRLADVGFGMPVMNAVAPTAGDFARYDRAGSMDAAPPTTTLERAAYDREKGAQALQRLYTLFLDPGKLDAHARGERQFGLNDRAGAGAGALGAGAAADAAAVYQRNSVASPERQMNDLALQRTTPTMDNEATARRGEKGAQDMQAAQLRSGSRYALATPSSDSGIGSTDAELPLPPGRDDRSALEPSDGPMTSRRPGRAGTDPEAMPSQPRSLDEPWSPRANGASPSFDDGADLAREQWERKLDSAFQGEGALKKTAYPEENWAKEHKPLIDQHRKEGPLEARLFERMLETIPAYVASSANQWASIVYRFEGYVRENAVAEVGEDVASFERSVFGLRGLDPKSWFDRLTTPGDAKDIAQLPDAFREWAQLRNGPRIFNRAWYERSFGPPPHPWSAYAEVWAPPKPYRQP